jgi:ribosome-associated protein
MAATDDVLRVSRSLSVPVSELTWRFTASGGPGGQHANRSNTRVELVFDIAGSPSLGPRQRSRLLERYGPALRVVASGERSQARNRAAALERLRDRLADGLRVERTRTATAPSRASKERRLEAKRHRSRLKQQRAPVTDS